MSDSFRSTPSDQQWSGANTGNGYNGASAPNASSSHENDGHESVELGKALLVGVLGGLVSAAGYFVYRRLPDEQKERIHSQVKTLVAQRITEMRQNFNI